MSGADELAWRDGQKGRALVSNAARRTRVCCSCLSTAAAQGDTFCATCRDAYDRGAFGPDSSGQMSWPAEAATAFDASGNVIPLHPDQLDLTSEPCVCAGTGQHDGQGVDSCDECNPTEETNR